VPTPRHVVLNALFLDPGISGGPETYLRGLAGGLRSEFPATRFEVVTTRRGGAALRAEGWEDVTVLGADEGQRGRRAFAELVALPRHARRRGASVIHSLASTGPGRTPAVGHVVTLHDVTFFHTATFNPVTTFGMKRMVTAAARDAEGLICGAAAARDDVAATLGIPPERFTVVHHGTKAIGPAAPEAEVRAAFDLAPGRPVVLNVATKRPHKNQELLLRALALMGHADATLVLVGHAEPYADELRRLAAELRIEPRVRFADDVSDPQLEALWKLAAVAAFPTRAEGFGLPVVEALARGVPVACSGIPVLREVGGTFVRPFGTDDPAGAASAIDAAIADGFPGGDPDAARAWGASFTWARAARETFAVYEAACSTSA
jgi:glycosyltransferase involved in cell wall biosynthesis